MVLMTLLFSLRFTKLPHQRGSTSASLAKSPSGLQCDALCHFDWASYDDVDNGRINNNEFAAVKKASVNNFLTGWYLM